MADGIARKLSTALALKPELNERVWRQLVQAATRDAFFEIPGGPLVRLNRNPSFADAVFDCTSEVVAPPGSGWALAVRARKEEATRKSFPW